VQAWLAWNESDVFSDASVRHLQSLITDFSRAIFRVLDWSLLRANICVRDIHGSARFCTCHYEVARLRIYLYLRWLDLGECGVASPVDAQKFCDRAAWNVGMVTIDAFQPSDLATPIRFVEVIQEHERIDVPDLKSGSEIRRLRSYDGPNGVREKWLHSNGPSGDRDRRFRLCLEEHST
jgi:hypothetical protein